MAPAVQQLLATVSVAAGYPAQDYFDRRINLNDRLIRKDVTSTYIFRVSGHSMEGAWISDGDELIVNRLRITPTGDILQAENPDDPDIRVPELASQEIWGTTSVSLHHLL